MFLLSREFRLRDEEINEKRILFCLKTPTPSAALRAALVTCPLPLITCHPSAALRAPLSTYNLQQLCSHTFLLRNITSAPSASLRAALVTCPLSLVTTISTCAPNLKIPTSSYTDTYPTWKLRQKVVPLLPHLPGASC